MLIELFILWVSTLLLIRLVVDAQRLLGLHQVVLIAVPLLFIYAPVLLCRWRGVDSYDYPLAIPAFRDGRAWWSAARLTLAVVAVIIVPWLVGYHLYQTVLFGYEFEGTLPSQPLMLVGYHLFFVAIPEEFFYRGYMQTRLAEVLPPRWSVLGTRVGPALLITSVVFAFGHTLVQFQWWHFAIFFPSLVFGWLRNRSGGVVAGALFHAWANVTVSTLDTLYGIIPS